MRSAHSGLSSSLRTSIARTSRAKISLRWFRHSPPFSCNPDSLSIRPVPRFWFYGTASINPLKNLKGSEGRPVQAFSPARTKWKKTLGRYSHP